MKVTINVNGQALTLLKFRSFLFENEKYTIFLDVDKTDSSQVYILKHLSDGSYKVPKEEKLSVLIPIIANIADDTEPFSFDNNPLFTLLPWNE